MVETALAIRERPKYEYSVKYFLRYAMIITCLLTFIQLQATDLPKNATVNCAMYTTCIIVITMLLFVATLNNRIEGNMRKFVVICTLIWIALVCGFYSDYFRATAADSLVFGAFLYADYGIIGVVTYVYWVVLTHYYDVKHNWKMPVALLLVYLVILASNPWTGILFDLNPDSGAAVPTLFQAIMVIIPVVVVAFALKSIMMTVSPEHRIRVSLLIIIPVSGILMQILYQGMAIVEMFYLLAMFLLFSTFYYSRGEKIAEQKLVIDSAKMRPHFIFNSLGAIMNIDGNPEATKEALLAFSSYLRNNLDYMGGAETITLEQEMDNVEAYVYLEKLRLKSKLTVEYNMKATGFQVPPFCIEVLVENSIKHGIIPKGSAGTVKVESWEDDDNYYIRVKDDGVGFDKNQPADPSRSHVGLNNLRRRIAKTCGGTLVVDGIVGMGAASTVTIPKKVKKR